MISLDCGSSPNFIGCNVWHITFSIKYTCGQYDIMHRVLCWEFMGYEAEILFIIYLFIYYLLFMHFKNAAIDWADLNG